MSDEQAGGTSYGQEAGTPSTPPQEQPPQYVTRDDLKRFGDEIIEQTKRAVQGLTDKQENRVEKRLKDWESRLGYTPKPEVREQARAELELDELRQPNGGGEVPTPSQAIDPVVKDTNKKLYRLLAQYDADLDELQGIDFSRNNPPERFLQQAEAMLKSKHPAAPAPSQPEQPVNLARAPIVGTGGSPIGGDRATTLNNRLRDIQETDPFKRNRELTKERMDILKELETLGK